MRKKKEKISGTFSGPLLDNRLITNRRKSKLPLTADHTSFPFPTGPREAITYLLPFLISSFNPSAPFFFPKPLQ